jgi:hypothetical protein
MRPRSLTHRSPRAGGASVEFGLVLPLLLLILLGLADTGWIFYNHGVLTRAVREGCRDGAVVDAGGDPATTASDAIIQLLDDWHYSCPSGELCEPEVAVETDARGRDVLVCSASVPVSSLTGLVVPFQGVSLSSATRTYIETWSSP